MFLCLMLPFPFPLPQIPSNVDQKSAEPRRENRESMSVEEVGKIDTREEARIPLAAYSSHEWLAIAWWMVTGIYGANPLNASSKIGSRY